MKAFKNVLCLALCLSVSGVLPAMAADQTSQQVNSQISKDLSSQYTAMIEEAQKNEKKFASFRSAELLVRVLMTEAIMASLPMDRSTVEAYLRSPDLIKSNFSRIANASQAQLLQLSASVPKTELNAAAKTDVDRTIGIQVEIEISKMERNRSQTLTTAAVLGGLGAAGLMETIATIAFQKRAELRNAESAMQRMRILVREVTEHKLKTGAMTAGYSIATTIVIIAAGVILLEMSGGLNIGS
jgi:hypothetical protein